VRRASGDTVHPQGREHEDGTKKTTFPPIGIVAHRSVPHLGVRTRPRGQCHVALAMSNPSDSCWSGSRDAIVPLVGDGRALDN
jgi:hypothetical protein